MKEIANNLIKVLAAIRECKAQLKDTRAYLSELNEERDEALEELLNAITEEEDEEGNV